MMGMFCTWQTSLDEQEALIESDVTVGDRVTIKCGVQFAEDHRDEMEDLRNGERSQC